MKIYGRVKNKHRGEIVDLHGQELSWDDLWALAFNELTWDFFENDLSHEECSFAVIDDPEMAPIYRSIKQFQDALKAKVRKEYIPNNLSIQHLHRLIAQNGRCNNLSCEKCPFGDFYLDNCGLVCNNLRATDSEDPKLVQAAKEILEKLPNLPMRSEEEIIELMGKSRSVQLTAAEVANERYKLFNPERWDFRWNHDYSIVTCVALRWWDDASYIAYQGDCGD